LVHVGAIRALDRTLLAYAQRPGGTLLDATMFGLSLLGSIEVTSLVVLTMFFSRRAAGAASPRWWLLAVFVAVNLVELLMKQLILSPSPPAALVRGPRLGVGLVTAGSFPSGHMARVAFLSGWAACRRLPAGGVAGSAPLFGALVLAIGYSRVYLAHHWSSDVVGGILLGGAALALLLAASGQRGEEAGA
jgi:membrane-associated phospholipid phosphatase